MPEFCDTPTLTLKNESSDPFSMYSTTIITGLPAKTHKNSTYTVFISEYFCGIVAHLQCRVEDKIEGARLIMNFLIKEEYCMLSLMPSYMIH